MIQLIMALLLQMNSLYSLTIDLKDVNVDGGEVYIALYSSKEGVPTDFTKANKMVKVHANKTSVTINELEQGTYAITVYQDTNKNGELDTSFIGIPKEPIGVSNNAKGFMGPPSFKDASFYLKGNQSIAIKMTSL